MNIDSNYFNKNDRSNDVKMVASNFDAILKSSSYTLAHEDRELLNADEMRGVRMLLEITKPEHIINKENILSTVIVFGGVNISENITAKRKLDEAAILLKQDPESEENKRNFKRLKNLVSMSYFYDSARKFAKLVSLESQ